MKYVPLAMVVFLVACQTPPTTPPVAVPEDTKTVEIDKELLKPCAEPVMLPSGKDTDNLKFTEANLTSLAECAVRHKGLVKVVKDAFNIKD